MRNRITKRGFNNYAWASSPAPFKPGNAVRPLEVLHSIGLAPDTTSKRIAGPRAYQEGNVRDHCT
jgi:hypothetical protein